MKLRFQSLLALCLASAGTLSAQSVDVAVLDETLTPINGLTLNFELEDGRVLGSALAYPGRYFADLGTDKSRLVLSTDIYGVQTLDLEHGVDSDIVVILGPDGAKTQTYATTEGMFLGNPTAFPVGDPAPLPNGTCDSAFPFPFVPGLLPGTNLGGGITAGFCDGLYGGFGSWFTVIGTGETMTASTCLLSTFNSGIRVFSGCGIFDCVAGSQDGCDSNDGARVSWESEAGQEYKILVHGFLLEAGAFVLSIDSEEPCPAAFIESISDGCGAHITASAPIIGSTGQVTLTSDNIFAQAFLFVGDPGTTPYTALGCDVYVLPTTLFQVFSTDSEGTGSVSFALPNDTSFCGEEFILQATVRKSFTASNLLVGGGGSSVPAISNAVHIGLGFDFERD